MSDEAPLPDTPKRRSLKAVVPLPPPPVPEVVELLRDWLARAERGEIVELAGAFIDNRADSHSDRTSLEYATVMMGELGLLRDEISEAVREEGDE